MALQKQDVKKVSARVFSCLSLTVAIVLAVIGIACCKSGAYTMSQVNEGLAKEKMYFPPADPDAYPDIVKYAEQQVDDGPKAKAYAEGFLDVQLQALGGGKTTAEIGAAAAMDPQNAALQQLQGAMFQVSTSKGMLLGSYGGWMQGQMIKYVGTASLVAAAILLVVSGMQYMRYKR